MYLVKGAIDHEGWGILAARHTLEQALADAADIMASGSQDDSLAVVSLREGRSRFRSMGLETELACWRRVTSYYPYAEWAQGQEPVSPSSKEVEAWYRAHPDRWERVDMGDPGDDSLSG